MAALPAETPSKRNRMKEGVRSFAGWAGLILPILGALLGLFAIFFLLQVVSLVPSLKGFDYDESNLGLSLQSESELFSDETHILRGNAQRSFSRIEVGVNEHLLETIYAASDGSFEISLNIPPQTNRIWIRAFDPDTGKSLGTEQISFTWAQDKIEPKLQFAYLIDNPKMIWIAGSSAPNAWIRLRDEHGQYLGEVRSNESGGFDYLLDVQEKEPVEITAQPVNPDGMVSEPVGLTPVDEFPLARQAVFDLTGNNPQLQLNVRLPVIHPNYLSLVQGYISSQEFLESIFPLSEAWYASDVTHTISSDPESNGPRTATVSITAQWKYALPKITIYRMPIHPLLTDQDSILLNFHGTKPAWFDPPFPTSLKVDQAVWQGHPEEAGNSYKAISVGLTLPPGARTFSGSEQPEAPQESEVEQLKMLDFIRNFEARGRGTLGTNTWRTLILLIPYAAMLWLWRRGQIGKPEIWRPMAAMIVALAVWRIWGYLNSLIQSGPGLWLQKAITPIRFWLNLAGTEKQNILLGDAPWNAYCILLLGLLALTPLYLPVLEQTLISMPKPAISSSQRRLVWLRRFILGMRVLLAILALTLIVALFQMQPGLIDTSMRGYPFPASLLQKIFTFVEQKYLVDPGFYLTILPVLAVALTSLTAFFLWMWNLPAGLFGLGLTIITLRAALAVPIAELGWIQDYDLIQQILSLPWWVFLMVTAGLTYPLVVRLLKILAPSRLMSAMRKRDFRLLRLLVAAGLLALAMWLPYTSSRLLLGAAGVLVLTALLYLVYYGLRNFELTSQFVQMVKRQPWIAVLAGVVVLAIAWPISGSATSELRIQSLLALVNQADNIFVFILALALILLLYEETCNMNSNDPFTRPVIEAGIVLFAVFLINSSTSWLFIPVPFLVGLLVAHKWLFRPDKETMEMHSVMVQASQPREKMIQDILDESKARSSYEKIVGALKKKLEAAEITGADYDSKLAEYQAHFGARLDLEQYPRGLNSKKIAFAVGDENPWTNTRHMLSLGAQLALLPLLIALYEYLPSSRVSYPYPLATLLVFLLSATASWLLYAFFFGYFYNHLRGSNGLTTGLVLFFGLVLPFAAYRLLSAQTLAEMRPFLLWAAQVFLFCTMLGLLGVEYRLIRQYGYQMRDLLAAHNLSALSVYASTVIAALAPTIIAALTGRLSDVVKFFLETVLPRAPGGGP